MCLKFPHNWWMPVVRGWSRSLPRSSSRNALSKWRAGLCLQVTHGKGMMLQLTHLVPCGPFLWDSEGWC